MAVGGSQGMYLALLSAVSLSPEQLVYIPTYGAREFLLPHNLMKRVLHDFLVYLI